MQGSIQYFTGKLIIVYLITTLLFMFPVQTWAVSTNALVDDFSHTNNNSLGIARQFLSDVMSGGKTSTVPTLKEGFLHLKGDIAPPRGQPGWASTVFLLDPKGLPQNLSDYDGIKLVIKVNSGNVSVSANSIEINNFDYHASPVIVRADGDFHEVKVPFASMKRAWSEQTQLNTQSINSLSIVAYDLQPGSFDFTLDEISFY